MSGESEIELISVIDIERASAYYASVFDAAVFAAAATEICEMRIGERRYRLAPACDPRAGAPHIARVPDVDVTIARAATRGGRILDAAHLTPAGREGRIEDPFGHCWIVSES